MMISNGFEKRLHFLANNPQLWDDPYRAGQALIDHGLYAKSVLRDIVPHVRKMLALLKELQEVFALHHRPK